MIKDDTKYCSDHWHPGRLHEFEQVCRNAGLKVTPQRLGIYRALVTTAEHPSADMLWHKVRRQFPTISLDTVNRTLLTLNEIGMAFIVEGSGDVKRFDGGSKNHQHLRCIRCRRIIDFHYSPFDNITLPAGIEPDFKILRKTVYFEGICCDCQKKP
jgi:Fur family peroxide stress response transcriptional regulator